MKAVRGTTQIVKGRLYGRFWLGGETRESVPLPGVDPDDEAAVIARCELISDLALKLAASGRLADARAFAELLGAARTRERVDAILLSARRLTYAPVMFSVGTTVRQFGELWTKGELARLFPDYVKVKRTAEDDTGILAKYVYPLIGTTPVRALELTACERVMAELPERLSPARRRHVAQTMHRLLRLAVYPAKLIATSPLPPRFLPKLRGEKAEAIPVSG
jgi:hypothetical protein